MKKYDEVSVVRQLNNVGAVIEINPASKVIKVAKNSATGYAVFIQIQSDGPFRCPF